ncbi:helix-turn-helix transcriptional regulator [Mycobacterium marinum]|uniref:helix-turn-helix transcriptional regulator n=1 Tax=Mycobacterium marinum TaxID=1781 RepID=UPI0035651C86
MTDRELIAALINIRQSRGLTQSNVAHRMHVCVSTVGHFEAGTHTPNLSTVMRYAKAVGARLTASATRSDAGYTHGIPVEFNAPRDCEHHWEPVSLTFDTELYEIDGRYIRVRIRQPDIDEARCYFICRRCACYTFMTTQFIGFRMYGSEDAAVCWEGDDPIPANNKRITPATERAPWSLTPDDEIRCD